MDKQDIQRRIIMILSAEAYSRILILWKPMDATAAEGWKQEIGNKREKKAYNSNP